MGHEYNPEVSLMDIVNPEGFASGVVVGIIATLAAYKSYVYYRKLEAPLSRRLAFTAFLSAVFSMLGSIGVMLQSTGRTGWVLMASFFTTSYIVLMGAIFFFLNLLHKVTMGEIVHSSGIITNGDPTPPGREEGLPAGGFTISASELHRIEPLCRLARATLYVGRNIEATWCPKFDGRIWVTRVNAPNSIDPSKLHVLQAEIIRFVSKHGGGTLVLIDGIEHLVLYNDFRSVMKFLTALKDYMLLMNSTMIVAIDEGTIEETRLSILRRELPHIDLEELMAHLEERALFGVVSREKLEKIAETEGA